MGGVKKKKKRKFKRKYGYQDKIQFEKKVEIQEAPKRSFKDIAVEMRNQHQVFNDKKQLYDNAVGKIVPDNMSMAEYLKHIEEKKKDLREKGVKFKY